MAVGGDTKYTVFPKVSRHCSATVQQDSKELRLYLISDSTPRFLSAIPIHRPCVAVNQSANFHADFGCVVDGWMDSFIPSPPH